MSFTESLAHFDRGDHEVNWSKTTDEHGKVTYTITYGQQQTSYQDDLAACREFGECVRHSLECAGKLDNPDGAVSDDWAGEDAPQYFNER